MADRPYSLHIGPAFLQTVRGFTTGERRSVARILRSIQRDPSIDGMYKINLAPDAPLTTCISLEFYVFYFIQRNTIFLVDIERI